MFYFTAFDYSGGYFNPVLATSLKYGCEGNTFAEHAIVYWIGACAGAVLSIYLYKMPFVKNMLQGKGSVTEESESIWGDNKDD